MPRTACQNCPLKAKGSPHAKSGGKNNEKCKLLILLRTIQESLVCLAMRKQKVKKSEFTFLYCNLDGLVLIS